MNINAKYLFLAYKMEIKGDRPQSEYFEIEVPYELYPKRSGIDLTSGIFRDILTEHQVTEIPVLLSSKIARYSVEVIYYIASALNLMSKDILATTKDIDPYYFFLVHDYFGAPSFFENLNMKKIGEDNPGLYFLLQRLAKKGLLVKEDREMESGDDEPEDGKRSYTKNDVDMLKLIAYNRVTNPSEESELLKVIKQKGSSYSKEVSLIKDDEEVKGLQDENVEFMIPEDIFPSKYTVQNLRQSYLKTVFEENLPDIPPIKIILPIKLYDCVDEVMRYICALSSINYRNYFEIRPIDMQCLYNVHTFFGSDAAFNYLFNKFDEGDEKDVMDAGVKHLVFTATKFYLKGRFESEYIVTNSLNKIEDVINLMTKDDTLQPNDYSNIINFLSVIRKREPNGKLSDDDFFKLPHDDVDSEVIRRFILYLLGKDINHSVVFKSLIDAKLNKKIHKIFTNLKLELIKESKTNEAPFKLIESVPFTAIDRIGYDDTLFEAMKYKPRIASYMIARKFENTLSEDNNMGKTYGGYLNSVINFIRIEDGLVPRQFEEKKGGQVSLEREPPARSLAIIKKIQLVLASGDQDFLINEGFEYNLDTRKAEITRLIKRPKGGRIGLEGRKYISPGIRVNTAQKEWKEGVLEFAKMLASPDFSKVTFEIKYSDGLVGKITTEEILDNILKALPEYQDEIENAIYAGQRAE